MRKFVILTPKPKEEIMTDSPLLSLGQEMILEYNHTLRRRDGWEKEITRCIVVKVTAIREPKCECQSYHQTTSMNCEVHYQNLRQLVKVKYVRGKKPHWWKKGKEVGWMSHDRLNKLKGG